MDNKSQDTVLLLGSGHALHTAMDALVSNGVMVYGILSEEEPQLDPDSEIPYLGKPDDETYLALLKKGAYGVIAAENTKERAQLAQVVKKIAKKRSVATFHAKAHYAPSSEAHSGVIVAAFALLEDKTVVEEYTIIGPGAVIERKAHVGKFCTIGAKAVVGAEAKIGDGVYIGAGAVLARGIKIGDGAQIMSGALVLQDVPKAKMMSGNPAKEVG